MPFAFQGELLFCFLSTLLLVIPDKIGVRLVHVLATLPQALNRLLTLDKVLCDLLRLLGLLLLRCEVDIVASEEEEVEDQAHGHDSKLVLLPDAT